MGSSNRNTRVAAHQRSATENQNRARVVLAMVDVAWDHLTRVAPGRESDYAAIIEAMDSDAWGLLVAASGVGAHPGYEPSGLTRDMVADMIRAKARPRPTTPADPFEGLVAESDDTIQHGQLTDAEVFGALAEHAASHAHITRAVDRPRVSR